MESCSDMRSTSTHPGCQGTGAERCSAKKKAAGDLQHWPKGDPLTWKDRSTKIVPSGLEYVEEMLQESRLSRWTFYRYSRSVSQRSSLSWITTRIRIDRTKVQGVGWTCKRRPHISSHSRGKEKVPGQWYLTLNKEDKKWTNEASIWLQSRCLDEKSFTPRIRRTNWRASPSRSTKTMAFIFKHIVVGQVWMELEGSSHFFLIAWISFCYSWFRLQSIAIHCDSRRVYTDTLHTRLFLDMFNFVHTSHCGSRCRSVCLIKSLMRMSSHVWVFVVSLLCLLPLSLSRLYFLSHCLLVLCPAHQLPCGRNRRGVKPLHSHTMRSIAPWRYTTLSHEQSYQTHQRGNSG